MNFVILLWLILAAFITHKIIKAIDESLLFDSVDGDRLDCFNVAH